jgi:hypothetical protein
MTTYWNGTSISFVTNVETKAPQEPTVTQSVGGGVGIWFQNPCFFQPSLNASISSHSSRAKAESSSQTDVCSSAVSKVKLEGYTGSMCIFYI